MPPRKRGSGRPMFRDRNLSTSEKPLIYKPRETYPALQQQPRLVPLLHDEVEIYVLFKAYRASMRNGPLYTVLEQDCNIHKPGEIAARWSLKSSSAKLSKGSSPFDAFPTYTQRFKRPQRPLPRPRPTPYLIPFLPPELHQYVVSTPPVTHNEVKQIRIANDAVEADEEGALNDEEEVEVEGLVEEEDDDFEADEDDDDDYNAENYFSDGKSDHDVDDGGNDDY